MKHFLVFALCISTFAGFGATATEQYADYVAAAAQTNAQNYATAIVSSATVSTEAKIAAATNGIPESIHAVDVVANAARDGATNAVTVATVASATATVASNVAATVSAALATERVQRQNADAALVSAFDAERTERTEIQTNLYDLVGQALTLVNNESTERNAADVSMSNRIDSVIENGTKKISDGTNVLKADGTMLRSEEHKGFGYGHWTIMMNGVQVFNNIPINPVDDHQWDYSVGGNIGNVWNYPSAGETEFWIAIQSQSIDETFTVQGLDFDTPYTFTNGVNTYVFSYVGDATLIQTKVASTNQVAVKQDRLVSGTNIKTINNQSILGAGNINISGGGGSGIGTNEVVDLIRTNSLGGIWDQQYQVWWTPVMANGKLTYQCTTNVNLNAGN